MSSVRIKVYEGESEYADENDFLGDLILGELHLLKEERLLFVLILK